MEEMEALLSKMQETGFTRAAEIPVEKLKFLEEVRHMCASNRCGLYGKNWSCPPACGTVEECAARVKAYRRGILVQYVGQLEDSFDIEGMTAAADRFREVFMAAADLLKESWPGLLALGQGHCGLCKSCGYPAEPCRFPEKLYTPPEGYGLMLSDVCAKCGVPYISGPNTVTYIGCFFLD